VRNGGVRVWEQKGARGGAQQDWQHCLELESWWSCRGRAVSGGAGAGRVRCQAHTAQLFRLLVLVRDHHDFCLLAVNRYQLWVF
jgi:hypothetical protein